MMTIDDLLIGQKAKVVRLYDPDASAEIGGELSERLSEIGFTHGESVAVLARSVPGGDPMVVRVGQSRFALRRVEARCIHVVKA